MEEIELGDKVKDLITGFVGIAVAKTTFINGCTQISIAEQTKKKPSQEGDPSIDITNLIILEKGYVDKRRKPKEKKKVKHHTGGKTTFQLGMRGY
jgi:hypothetical protein